MLLKHLLAEGNSKAEAARRLGISVRTVRRWTLAGDLDRDLDAPPRYKPRPPRPSVLDPFKDLIRDRLDEYPRLSAVRLFEEVRALGFTGSYSLVRNFARQVRPRPSPEPIVRFETAPGEQAQVDFAEFRFPWGRRFAFVIVLGYSRMLFVRFFERQDMNALFEGLEGAFAAFGGVPREVLFDQMRAVITADLRLMGGQLMINEEFLRFAAHYGFRARACRPYRAKTKGKVERPIRYLRDNFAYGRDFVGDDHLAESLARWLEQANARTHATTKEVPHVRFERDEYPSLHPLPARAYRSLVLQPPADPIDGKGRTTSPTPWPLRRVVEVEKRPLSIYAAIAGGAR